VPLPLLPAHSPKTAVADICPGLNPSNQLTLILTGDMPGEGDVRGANVRIPSRSTPPLTLALPRENCHRGHLPVGLNCNRGRCSGGQMSRHRVHYLRVVRTTVTKLSPHITVSLVSSAWSSVRSWQRGRFADAEQQIGCVEISRHLQRKLSYKLIVTSRK